MRLRIILTITLFGSVIVSIGSRSVGIAQTNTESISQMKVTLPPKVVVRNEGWDLPFVQTSSKKEIRTILLGKTAVEKQHLIPTSELFKFEEFYPQLKELRIDMINCRVGSVFAYSIRGRVFAYQTVFSPVSISDGNQVATAAVISMQFTDRDGDGTFETRIRTTAEPEIPSWAMAISTP